MRSLIVLVLSALLLLFSLPLLLCHCARTIVRTKINTAQRKLAGCSRSSSSTVCSCNSIDFPLSIIYYNFAVNMERKGATSTASDKRYANKYFFMLIWTEQSAETGTTSVVRRPFRRPRKWKWMWTFHLFKWVRAWSWRPSYRMPKLWMYVCAAHRTDRLSTVERFSRKYGFCLWPPHLFPVVFFVCLCWCLCVCVRTRRLLPTSVDHQ